MKTASAWPPCPPRWLRYVGVWVLLMVLCGPQTIWSGAAESWAEVFWIQVNYWTSWAILAPAIFWLCRQLYEGPRTWRRYVPGLLLGALGVALLHPLIQHMLVFAREWGEWSLSMRPDRPTDFVAKVVQTMMKGSGTNPFMFAVIAIVWHAMRYSTDLREKQLKAMELESRLRDAQLQALRSQLNPHFLFNTLHSIAELVHTDANLAEQQVLRLGDLLRRVLASSSQPEIALAEEIEFIKAYLGIEQMRLGDRLKLRWEVAEDVLDVKVPSLLLQPLVENAIQHGIAPFTRPGELLIRASRINGFLHLQVRDRGPGLPPQGERRNARIGLSNTAARLRTIYGDQHQFELINNDGLTINLRLPIPAPTSLAATAT